VKEQPDPPPEDASPKEKMAYKLKTEFGQALYRLRKSTVEPVIGIIKEVLGFRQFSLRGLVKAAGEWNLVCIAFNLLKPKRFTLPAARNGRDYQPKEIKFDSFYLTKPGF
jgi:hypothetical protein